MKSHPYLRLFAWIATSIAISIISYHLLKPDFARRDAPSVTSAKPESRRETSAEKRLAKPSGQTTRAADRSEPAKQIAQRFAHLHQQRDELRTRIRANPDDPALHAELQQLASEEEQLTAAKAKLLDAPLVSIDGSRLSHFEGDQPVYLRDHNANASISTAATQVRSTSPYNVDGSGVIIGLWEVGGLPRDTHNDLTGRVTLGDSGSSSYHATHVAGTLIGSGSVSASAKGMATGATIEAYDATSSTDLSSEASAIVATGEGSSTKIYLSNQSWGTATGWNYNSSTGKYSWYGTFSDDGNASNDMVKPYGQYSSDSRTIDALAVDYPYLTMFFSAGNDRGYDTPASGETWYLNGSTAYTFDPATHPKDNEDWMVDGSITGYGTISPQSTAKNVISVGAVNDAVSSGSRSTAAAGMSDFSAYGPTDDGRIKPDLVANGVSLTSLSNTSNTALGISSGTSMSCPNAAGSAALLVDYFDNEFPGQSMRSSMLKALLIHTADDLGNAGPDYRYGWGLIDVKAAADLIKDTASDTTKSRMIDGQLSDASDTFTFDYDGSGELRVTLAWTDPEASSTSSHNSRTSRLINDLNLTLTGPDGAHYPFVMPWAGNWSDSKLNAAATTGVNSIDNVEQVYLSAPASGTYTITIDHAGSLSGSQIYSLILTGGDFASEVPDGGSNLSYTKVSGFGSIQPFNVFDRFSSAHETTYAISVDDPTVVTAAIDGSGNVVITEAGTGSTNVYVTATNDLGESDTVQITVNVNGNVIYVDASHTSGTKNGTSWATAYDKLYDAISAASSGQEIWVADGVYFPTTTSANPGAGDRYTSFDLRGGVPIYGGFAGNETSLEDRDPNTNISILSGDLDTNDLNRSDGITDEAAEIVGKNTLTVVRADANADNFVLDGFTVTAGATANASFGLGDDAAGMFIASGCSGGTVSNCRFMGNSAEDQGGAVYNAGTNSTFDGCTFSGNASGGNGGAFAGNKAVTLVDCTFQSNDALGHGGAVYLTGSTHLIRRCTFQANTCEMDGGAISFTDGGNAVFTNCLITGNRAYGGTSKSNGAAFAVGSGSILTITNCTICSNNSEYSGGAFWVFGASNVYLRNTIVYRNAVAGNESASTAYYWVYDSDSHLYWTYSITPESTYTDPELEDVPAASSAPTTAGDFKISANGRPIDFGSGSATIDATGVYSGTASEEESDLAGNTRVVDGNYNGTVYIDAGCYERDEPATTATLADVTINPSTGSSSSSVDLDDYFGGNELTYEVSSSSPGLLIQIDAENNLIISLANVPLNDSTYTITVTATDNQGQSIQQVFTLSLELTRLYVSKTATGTATGRSWTDAFTDLPDAMAYASSGDEIWISEGVYKPSNTDPAIGFTLDSEVSIHGGFGGEGGLDEADPSAHVTVISGDIDGDDTVDSDGVTLAYTDQGAGNTSVPLFIVNSSATLSGLVICGGTAGGIRTNSGSTLTLTDCIVRGNKITGDGGALNCLGGNHSFTDCQFLQNRASGHAGGIRNGVTGGTMTLDRCTLSGNSSGSHGGAFAIKGGTSSSRNIRMRDCLLTGNQSGNDGGAIHSWVANPKLYLTNCTIASNKAADEGGSIFLTGSTTLTASNTIVWGNSSDPAIKTGSNAVATWKSCLVEGSGGSAAWDDTEMGTDGGNNLDTDPLVTSLPDSSTAPTLAGDFTFNALSPAFDAGNDSLSTSSTDLIGNARINDTAIDMGAYENISLHRPTFTLPGDITINEDFGTYEDYFATDIQTNDVGQSIVGFTVTTDNDALFSQLPSLDAGGYLEFTPADNAYGTATVTVVLHDDGASVNESLPQTLIITVLSQTDAPTDMALDNTTVNEGTAFVGTVSATEPFGQTITYSIVNADDGQAFAIDAATGELSFLYAPDFELPWDSNSDNIYSVVIQATGSDGAQTAQFTVTVLDLVDNFVWSNTTGDNLWTTPGNWDVAQLPNTIANVYLAEAGTALLNDGSTQEISTLRIGDTGGLGDLRLSNASQLSVSSGIIVGDGKDDRLSLESGSILTTSGILKAYSTSVYSTTIGLSGGSQWTHTYGNVIDTFGSAGEVTCTISEASNLTLAAASGAAFKFAASGSVVNLNVAGSGSGFDYGSNSLQLGMGGEFHLTVSDHAAFGASGNGSITLGQNAGASVSASFLSGASLETGGSLSIKNGASLLMNDATVSLETLSLTSGSATLQNGTTGSVGWINFLAANPVTLDGAGTDITLSGSSPSLGDGGAITVQNGASMHYTSTTDFNLYGSGAAGSFTVTGIGSSATFAGGLTNTSNTESATFTVAAGASASFAGASQLKGNQNLVVTGSGSSATFSNNLTLTGGNSLTIADGAELTVDGFLTIGSGETLELTGGATLVVSTVAGSPTNTSGTLSPGDGPKAVGIEGGYIQLAGGTLALEIGGTTQGSEYDYLYTLGYIDLAGTVSVTLIDGFEPAAGDSFTVLTSASFITDSGFSLSLPALTGGKQWETELTEDTLTLTVVGGDALAAFRSAYGLAEDGSDDNADWSQNGVANIFYYLFGLGDPNEGNIDRTLLPTLTSTGDNIIFTYRSPSTSDPLVSYAVTSTDLETWEDLSLLNGEEAPVDVTASMESDGYLRYSITIPATRQGRFFTVRPQTSAAE